MSAALRAEPVMGPCAKKVVTCSLYAADGRVFVGRNDCANPQAVCPRLPGDGYELCVATCQQPGHAEIMALVAAGDAAAGSIARIDGIGHVCRPCQEAMEAAGVVGWYLGDPA